MNKVKKGHKVYKSKIVLGLIVMVLLIVISLIPNGWKAISILCLVSMFIVAVVSLNYVIFIAIKEEYVERREGRKADARELADLRKNAIIGDPQRYQAISPSVYEYIKERVLQEYAENTTTPTEITVIPSQEERPKPRKVVI